MTENDGAPAWAVPLIKDIGEMKGTLVSLNAQFGTHVADDKLVAGKVEVMQTQIASMSAASGVKAKIFAGITHALASAFGAGVTMLAKKIGL